MEDVRVEEDAAEVAEDGLGVERLTLEKEEEEGGLKEDCAEREGNKETLTVEVIK